MKLQAVNGQTLLKLVGLLYSGLLEVNETTDQEDVLAAANQLGLDRLVDGQEDACGREGAGLLAEDRKEREKRVTCDAEVQGETKAKRDAETQFERTGFVDAATQTVGAQSDVWASSSSQDPSLPGALAPGATTALVDETGLSKEVTKTTITATKSSSAPRSTRVSSELSYCIQPKLGSLQREAGTRETAEGERKKMASGEQSTQTKGKRRRKHSGKMSGRRQGLTRGSAQTREIATKVIG